MKKKNLISISIVKIYSCVLSSNEKQDGRLKVNYLLYFIDNLL